jgi:hypothetical protein
MPESAGEICANNAADTNGITQALIRAATTGSGFYVEQNI